MSPGGKHHIIRIAASVVDTGGRCVSMRPEPLVMVMGVVGTVGLTGPLLINAPLGVRPLPLVAAVSLVRLLHLAVAGRLRCRHRPEIPVLQPLRLLLRLLLHLHPPPRGLRGGGGSVEGAEVCHHVGRHGGQVVAGAPPPVTAGQGVIQGLGPEGGGGGGGGCSAQGCRGCTGDGVEACKGASQGTAQRGDGRRAEAGRAGNAMQRPPSPTMWPRCHPCSRGCRRW